jgi:O-acetyl-ADP-ribose deacetylase (regulator of RNase III)
MIEAGSGDLLDADVEAIVNTVNTVGVMGKGLALQFKRRFPANFDAYAAACKRGEVEIGRMLVVETKEPTGPRYIINFPTKKHWRDPSRLEYVRVGLNALVDEIRARGIRSIAVPPLGCGNGGLAWSDVEPLIERAVAELPDVRVAVFAPSDIRPELAPGKTAGKPISRARALLVKLIDAYATLDYALTKIEVQKLAYFLQAAGEDLRLRYAKQQFGPYADQLRHVLIEMEGTLLTGVTAEAPRAEIRLLPGATAAADQLIGDDIEARARLERVGRLIRGYETPYSMELLATVHWVASHEGARAPAEARDRVQSWNERKKARYQERHIEKAWQRLESEGWIGGAGSAASP